MDFILGQYGLYEGFAGTRFIQFDFFRFLWYLDHVIVYIIIFGASPEDILDNGPSFILLLFDLLWSHTKCIVHLEFD